MKKDTKPLNITIKRNYRDEICSGCKKTFRAGFACSGYSHIVIVGYRPVGLVNHNMLCPTCTDVVFRLLGADHQAWDKKCPMAFFKYNNRTKRFNKTPSTMTINGKNMKYDKYRLFLATQKFAAKMKKKEPWSNVDYYKIAGVKITK
jgi:hypothetical protein